MYSLAGKYLASDVKDAKTSAIPPIAQTTSGTIRMRKWPSYSHLAYMWCLGQRVLDRGVSAQYVLTGLHPPHYRHLPRQPRTQAM